MRLSGPRDSTSRMPWTIVSQGAAATRIKLAAVLIVPSDKDKQWIQVEY
jgi:hypothetical protein